MWHIFMTHDALDCYGDPHCQTLLYLAHTVSPLWLHEPDTQLANTFSMYSMCFKSIMSLLLQDSYDLKRLENI